MRIVKHRGAWPIVAHLDGMKRRRSAKNRRLSVTSNPRILIAGAGVGGPALALFLKRAGISSAIYEAYPRSEGVGGGLNLAPNGMNVLAELGLAKTLVTRATVARESVFVDERGK